MPSGQQQLRRRRTRSRWRKGSPSQTKWKEKTSGPRYRKRQKKNILHCRYIRYFCWKIIFDRREKKRKPGRPRFHDSHDVSARGTFGSPINARVVVVVVVVRMNGSWIDGAGSNGQKEILWNKIKHPSFKLHDYLAPQKKEREKNGSGSSTIWWDLDWTWREERKKIENVCFLLLARYNVTSYNSQKNVYTYIYTLKYTDTQWLLDGQPTDTCYKLLRLFYSVLFYFKSFSSRNCSFLSHFVYISKTAI